MDWEEGGCKGEEQSSMKHTLAGTLIYVFFVQSKVQVLFNLIPSGEGNTGASDTQGLHCLMWKR